LNVFKWLALCCISSAALGEDVFLVTVEAADPIFTASAKEKVLNQLVGTCIDNGKEDELIIAVRYGAIYNWSAELWIGPRIVPLTPTPDLIYSGVRLKLGDLFTKDQANSMKVVITRGILK
jgi:hypothetical protein